MITIPKKVEYSVLLISNLAQNPDKTTSLREVSKKTALPYRFLGQLASYLKQGGVLESKEGVGGGYRLKAGWRDKSFYDLLVILEEDKHLVTCLNPNGKCVRMGKCSMQKIWGDLEKTFIRELQALKLSSV